MKKISYCPICGYGPFKEAYKSAQELRYSYEICDCCGCEYGYSDTEQHFEEWKNNGCIWSVKKAKPNNWSLDEQLSNIIRPWPAKNT